MKRILISGASGFVGSFLLPKLIEEGHNILALSRNPKNLKKTYGNSVSACKIEETKRIEKFKPQIVINLATYSNSSDEKEIQKEILEANIIYLSFLLDAIKKLNIELFVNTGTFAEYFSNTEELDPAYFYSATKTAGRYIIKYYSKTYNFKYINVIPYSIYGPNDQRRKLIHILLESFNGDNAINTTEGNQILDFIYIDDVVDAYLKIIDRFDLVCNEQNLIVGTGVGLSIKELVANLEEITGKRTNINWGAIPYRKRDIMYAVANIEETKTLLNWKPNYSIKEGLYKMLRKDNIL